MQKPSNCVFVRWICHITLTITHATVSSGLHLLRVLISPKASNTSFGIKITLSNTVLQGILQSWRVHWLSHSHHGKSGPATCQCDVIRYAWKQLLLPSGIVKRYGKVAEKPRHAPQWADCWLINFVNGKTRHESQNWCVDVLEVRPQFELYNFTSTVNLQVNCGRDCRRLFTRRVASVILCSASDCLIRLHCQKLSRCALCSILLQVQVRPASCTCRHAKGAVASHHSLVTCRMCSNSSSARLVSTIEPADHGDLLRVSPLMHTSITALCQTSKHNLSDDRRNKREWQAITWNEMQQHPHSVQHAM